MTKLTMLVELDYDDEAMHGDDKEARDWFFDVVLKGGSGLLLYSDVIGDEVGNITVLRIKGKWARQLFMQ